MACTIQDYGFTKNGYWIDWNDCKASLTDTIAAKANIYFDSAMGNVKLWFNIIHPDNTNHWWMYQYNISSSGTQSLDVGMGTLNAGNYYINEVDITPANDDSNNICQATGTPNYCRSLSVISGGGGVSPPVINYKGMSYHNWGGCNEFGSCSLTPSDASGKYVCIMVNVTTYTSGTYRISVDYSFPSGTGSTYVDFNMGIATQWYGLRFDALYTTGTYSVTNATIQKVG